MLREIIEVLEVITDCITRYLIAMILGLLWTRLISLLKVKSVFFFMIKNEFRACYLRNRQDIMHFANMSSSRSG
jgi:hypothetical protein